METSSIILLVISASISFGLGRAFVYFRDKKRRAQKEQSQKREALVLCDRPSEPESKNKSKRKRQIQMMSKAVKKHWSACFFSFSLFVLSSFLIGCKYIVKCLWAPTQAAWLKLLCRLPWSEFHLSFQSLICCRAGTLFSLKVPAASQVDMRSIRMPWIRIFTNVSGVFW